MTINIYDTRTLLVAINLMKTPYTFLRDTFFSNVDTFVTENVDVDFKKGKRKMAPFVAPRIGGVVMDRQGFVTNTYKPPKIAPERPMVIDDISSRGMGESLYSQKTPEERAHDLLASDLVELDDTIIRREEWMCREVLLNGKIIMTGEGFEQQVDFNFTNKEALTTGDRWSQTDTSNPYNDLKEKRREIIKKTGKNPNICVMDAKAWELFVEHPAVKEKLNLLRLKLGTIEPSIEAPSLTFMGKLNELNLEIYTYDEWFLDDNGDEQPMIPEYTVIIGSVGMNRRFYGAVTQMENGKFVTIEGARVPKVWNDEDNDIRKVRITSRPLPVPDDVDAWYILTVN